MKKYLALLFAMASGILSCEDELGGRITSLVINDSGHEVSLSFYDEELIDSQYSTTIDNHQEIEILVTSGSNGLSAFPSEPSIYEFDSLVVTFDNGHRTVHCGFRTRCSRSGELNYDHQRNFFNMETWDEKVQENTKTSFIAIYTYTFTEQDYLDAQ